MKQLKRLQGNEWKVMKINEIVDLALTYQCKDKLTKQVITQKPRFDYLDNILYIHTPVIPYKLVVLKRLLNVSSYQVDNIIIGKPDV